MGREDPSHPEVTDLPGEALVDVDPDRSGRHRRPQQLAPGLDVAREPAEALVPVERSEHRSPCPVHQRAQSPRVSLDLMGEVIEPKLDHVRVRVSPALERPPQGLERSR